MSLTGELISEAQAQELSGLSLDTLNRFVETGYLKVERNASGTRTFARSEIERLFGAPSPSAKVESLKSTAAKSEESTSNSIEPEVISSLNDNSDDDLSSESSSNDLLSKNIEVEREVTSLPEIERELIRTRGALELQTTLLRVREQEIKELKQQRIWLEQRLEKAEQMHQREQVLLLAESETVRRLVQNHNRSPLRLALEWLGLGPESSPHKTPTAKP